MTIVRTLRLETGVTCSPPSLHLNRLLRRFKVSVRHHTLWYKTVPSLKVRIFFYTVTVTHVTLIPIGLWTKPHSQMQNYFQRNLLFS